MKSIKYQILIPVVVIVVILSLVLTVTSVISGSSNIQEEAMNSLKYQASSFDDMSLIINEAKNQLSTIDNYVKNLINENHLTENYVQNGLSKDLENYVFSFLESSKNFRNIDFITNTEVIENFSYISYEKSDSNNILTKTNLNENILTKNNETLKWYYDTLIKVNLYG